MKIWLSVEELGLLREERRKRFNSETVGVGGRGEKFGATWPPGGEGGEIGGILDDDFVAGVEEDAADEVDALLGAGGD